MYLQHKKDFKTRYSSASIRFAFLLICKLRKLPKLVIFLFLFALRFYLFAKENSFHHLIYSLPLFSLYSFFYSHLFANLDIVLNALFRRLNLLSVLIHLQN